MNILGYLKNNEIKKIIQKGIIHIVSANFVNKVLQFATSIFLVRLLSKNDYGVWSYAINILSFFLLFNGFGASAGTLQFCSRASDRNQKLAYLKLGYKLGLTSNFIIGILIILFASFYRLSVPGSNNILIKIAFIPLFTVIYDISGNGLRANLANKKFSSLAVINTSMFFIASVLGIYLYKINGLIVGRYLAYLIIAFIALYFIRSEYWNKDKKKTIINKREYIKFSSLVAISNATSSILYLLDTFFVGLILKNGLSVASYKTAMIIPFSLNFLPKSILLFAYPYFAKNYDNINYIIKYYKKLFKGLLLMNGIISIFLLVFAKFIISLVFGEQYLDSVGPFRILTLSFFIAGSFRVPAGNVLASLNKVNINLYIAIFSGIFNIILDIIMIRKYGNYGAAIATVIVFAFSSLLSNLYLFRYFRKRRN